jgi:predicted dinucleotide-binding enzyme
MIKEAVQGKVLVDVTVPLNPPKVSTVHLPAGGAASLEAQQYLGPDVRVVAAFQNISAELLKDPNHGVDCDVLVCGNDKEAKQEVIGGRGRRHARFDAGKLENSIADGGVDACADLPRHPLPRACCGYSHPGIEPA